MPCQPHDNGRGTDTASRYRRTLRKLALRTVAIVVIAAALTAYVITRS